jgi:hypothetical protein
MYNVSGNTNWGSERAGWLETENQWGFCDARVCPLYFKMSLIRGQHQDLEVPSIFLRVSELWSIEYNIGIIASFTGMITQFEKCWIVM